MHNIKELTDREHILKRPNMYIGAINLTKSKEYILKDNQIDYTEVEYIPGLIKIINEIIDNSLDVAIKTNFKSSNIISVKMDNKKIQVQDNGTGIPVLKNEQNRYLPEVCWNSSRSGSNFVDDENHTQIGMNGVGAYATACFSKKFIGKTDDGKNHYTITIKNNAETFTENITETKSQGTDVTFYPDLEKFGITEIDEIHKLIVKQRLLNLAINFPLITFKFNGRKINTSTFKKYLSLFNPISVSFETEKYKFAILPNADDDFRQFSYVNGLRIPDGGTHIDIISYKITDGIRKKLLRKYKSIKPGDIRNKLFIIAFLKDLPTPKFSSQSKEKITNSNTDINKYFETIEWDKLVNKILKTPEIINNITEIYRIKEEFQKRKELQKLDKVKKKPKSDKFMPPIGQWNNIFLAEGDSASNSISKILGRQGNGFFAMFGVPPNAYDSSISDIIKSKKMIELQNILGLKFSQDTQDSINFKNIIITTDFDLPGHFIAGQLLGLFYRFGKNLFEEKRVKRFVTPLIIALDKNDNIKEWFYSFDDYTNFQKKYPGKYKYDYKKGLGSWDPEELEVVIQKDGLQNMLETFVLDEGTKEAFDSWLNSKNADKRKALLEGFEFNIMTA